MTNCIREPLMMTLCLAENSILFNKAILETLSCPKHVQMLINEDQKKLLLQACTTDDREAVVVPPSSAAQFELSGHSLLKRIRRLTGWNDDLPRVIYGSYMPMHGAIVFDLMTAQPAQFRMPSDNVE